MIIALAVVLAQPLYYFRDYYVGTQCTIEDSLIACMVQGDYHANDVFFPRPDLDWI